MHTRQNQSCTSLGESQSSAHKQGDSNIHAGKMARKTGPQPLTLGESTQYDGEQQFIDGARSPASLKSPKSPRSPFKFTTKKTQGDQSLQASEPWETHQNRTDLPQSQTAPALHQYSTSAGEEERQERRERPAKGGFFSNYKASKSSSRLQDSSRGTEEGMSRDTDRPAMSGKVSSQDSGRNDSEIDRMTTRKPIGGPSKSQSINATNAPNESSTSSGNTLTKKNKPKPFNLLSRTKSIRGDEQSPRDSSPNNKHLAPAHAHNDSVRTAPLQSERSFRDMMSSNVRNHSADRQPTASRDISGGRDKENIKAQSTLSSSLREGSGHGFLNNLKSSASKGAGALSKGLFGKGGRSGSTTEKEVTVDDEHYELKVINKPLIQQTRLTRISKKLEDSRDKTEFWMPAFPWRAIDYLNYKGSDVEGLYRVPGSSNEIKKWQRRFDEELDIDLFEQDDLYDINIIGSMLKSWLRELPDELFPKAAQDRIARQCQPNNPPDTVPQLLIDELSNLSPFNYYLLFAITCHLSLLLAHSDKNKMNFQNLCICFQPCMKIDMFCFKYLVCDWRDCWKGCKTEAEYIEAEYKVFSEQGCPPTDNAEGRSSTAVESHDERNVSSSDSSKPSSVSVGDYPNRGKGQQAQGQERNGGGKLPLAQGKGGQVSTQTLLVKERTTPKRSADMRPLSPIKPLSPIGL